MILCHPSMIYALKMEYNAALVDLLMENIKSWEEERKKTFLYDEVWTPLLCNTAIQKDSLI